MNILDMAEFVYTTHCDERPDVEDISLSVIHNISLPPGEFGGPFIQQLFCGDLDPEEHEYFAEICEMRVSAHLLIDRQGQISQFVPFDKRAWHAGESEFAGRTACNDFSIGIELEGTDDQEFTDVQYEKLAEVTRIIMHQFPKITLDRIVGHSDIAPGRKTDPGPHFDWTRFKKAVTL